MTTAARIRRKHPVFGIKLNLLSSPLKTGEKSLPKIIINALQGEPNVFSSYVKFLRMRAGGSRANCAHTTSSQACFWDSCDVSAAKKVYVPLGQGMVLVLFLVAIFLKDIFCCRQINNINTAHNQKINKSVSNKT